jgi:hypothetical protein
MMNIEYGKEPRILDEMGVKKEDLCVTSAEKIQQLLADRVKCAEREYREKTGQIYPDPEVLIDLLYQLAKTIRNVSGKEPSSVGLETGRLLCKLRCLDGERYDREVLLLTKMQVEVDCTAEGALEAAKRIIAGSQK